MTLLTGLVVVILAAGVFYLKGGAAWLNPSGSAGDQNVEVIAPSTTAEVTSKPANLDEDYLQRVLRNVDQVRRRGVLENPAAFQELIDQEASKMSLLAAARANNIDQDENLQFLMQRAADNLLLEVYLNRLITANMPANYPDDSVISAYFEENKPGFATEDQIPVWQVFLPIRAEMTAQDIASLEDEARKLADRLQAGDLYFSSAVTEKSAHLPSRYTGGFLGLIKVSELLPELREAIIALPMGQVSDPLRSGSGLHIVKRGDVVPGEQLALEQVKDQIKNILINQRRTKLTEEALRLAREQYPVSIEKEKLETWRQASLQ